MRNLLFTFSLLIFNSAQLLSQSILVQPYIQDAEPNSVKILWESTNTSNNAVNFGTNANNLNQTVIATSVTSSGSNEIHTASITGLNSYTRYYYQVTSDGVTSTVYNFFTPPTKDSEQSFNLVAMSDMQKDGSHPFKFQEVVQDGVLDYFETETGEDDISKHLGFVMIPGDLVVNGNNYGQWQNDFFGQAESLLAQVPVYPVLGNHENNSGYYFQYFDLPLNGSSGYEEHWWYKDYSNVRIIGLNSNSGYRIQTQLDWLDGVLDDACQDDDIDFVFAQLHHPFKSELWTPGELNYTGDVIQLLENFTTDCEKPSIHFFGHTHGYSRGQSRDHNHLWVNVATAGGAIDNWGEFPNADYEEFTKSIDEYGFVVLNVEAGNNPQFVMKRITRGDQDVTIDNVEQDIITIKKNEIPPVQPTGLFPSGADINPDCFILQANAFNDSGDEHQASHWQISTDCGDFSNPIFDSWWQHENWYDEVDTQMDDDLTNEEVSGLDENENYCWRVRYRDEHLEWSDWSQPTAFTTGASSLSENLIANHDAENGINNWVVQTGTIESLTDGECNGEAPHSGSYYFAVGGLCDGNETSFSEVHQVVDVQNFSDDIDTGLSEAVFGGYLSNYSGSDQPAMSLEFLDVNDAVLASSIVLTTTNDPWTLLENNEVIPALTRSIRVILTGTRIAGTDNDSYFDDLFLQISDPGVDDCSELPLPVEIYSFRAECKERFVALQWEVAGESDIQRYEIERSINATDWELAGSMYPSASSLEYKVYEFRDFERSDEQPNYYRIRVVETDRSFYFSEIISGDCYQQQAEISIYPNPSFDQILYLDIRSIANVNAEINVNNLLGQTIYSKTIQLETGMNTIPFETESWAIGYYTISINSLHWQWTGKALKQ